MNRPDDFDAFLRDRLSSAIGAEPPMESLPYADLARGRRLDRRRRWAAVSAATTVVPALSLGAYAVAGGFGDAGGTGPTTVRIAPADGGESTDPGGSEGTLTSRCSTSPDSGTGAESSKASISVGPAQGLGVRRGRSSEKGRVDCLSVDRGTPRDSADVDRVTKALNRHVDPNGSHAGTTISGSVQNADRGGKSSAIYAGYEWTDGNRTGIVTLSIEDPSVGNGDSCADPSSVNGPKVSCTTRTLEDGTTVLVGRGQQGGAERVTVRYVRPDGTLVWATANESTEQWWTDQSGAPPLTSLPVTVDQLIDLVRDPDVRL